MCCDIGLYSSKIAALNLLSQEMDIKLAELEALESQFIEKSEDANFKLECFEKTLKYYKVKSDLDDERIAQLEKHNEQIMKDAKTLLIEKNYAVLHRSVVERKNAQANAQIEELCEISAEQEAGFAEYVAEYNVPSAKYYSLLTDHNALIIDHTALSVKIEKLLKDNDAMEHNIGILYDETQELNERNKILRDENQALVYENQILRRRVDGISAITREAAQRIRELEEKVRLLEAAK
jgi:hypothetical protein